MRISIIIPTIEKTLPYLLNCIDSIKRNSTEEHDIIIVSNWGDYYNIPIDSVYIRRFHLKEQGQCKAVNHGVDQMDTKYAVVVDDDMVFPPEWEKILDHLNDKEFLVANVMEPGLEGSSFLKNNCGDNLENFNLEKFEKDILEHQEDTFKRKFGFPLFFTKELWKFIKGYDEQFDPWGSNCDSDLQYKLALAGVPFEQYQGVLFYHFAKKSGTFDKEQEGFWYGNMAKFEDKWGFQRVGGWRLWNCEFIIPLDKLKFRPSWAKLEDNDYIQQDESFNQIKRCNDCGAESLIFKHGEKCYLCG